MFCFYSWAIEVERYLGRVRFIKFAALLILLLPLVLGMWHLAGISAAVSGNYVLTASMLIAFATLYPNIEYFGWIPLKWFAFACFCIGSLMYFPDHNWVGLTLLWASCGASFGFVRYLQTGGSVEVGEAWEKVNPFKRRGAAAETNRTRWTPSIRCSTRSPSPASTVSPRRSALAWRKRARR
jgi:hypothetical protein